MDGSFPVTETLAQGAALAERVLLKVEELELLVTYDRPRRLVDMAQAELAAAVADADNFWAGREGDFVDEAARDVDAQREWQAFRALLAHSARRAAQASAAIAARLAVCEDALAALGLHREYGQDGAVRARPALPDHSTVMA
jgi:hypothetical protein